MGVSPNLKTVLNTCETSRAGSKTKATSLFMSLLQFHTSKIRSPEVMYLRIGLILEPQAHEKLKLSLCVQTFLYLQCVVRTSDETLHLRDFPRFGLQFLNPQDKVYAAFCGIRFTGG